jgi:hypothetical protein
MSRVFTRVSRSSADVNVRETRTTLSLARQDCDGIEGETFLNRITTSGARAKNHMVRLRVGSNKG